MKSVIAQRCSAVSASRNDGIGVPFNPVRHRPEDVVARRPAAERPALREVRPPGSDGPSRPSASAPTIRRRGRACRGSGCSRPLRRASSPARSLLDDELGRARERHRLGHVLRVGELGRERRDEVGEVRHFLVREIGPGRHRRVGHAALDDVDEVLMRRERAVRRRAHLELAGREVARLREADAAWRSLRRPPSRRGTARSTSSRAACPLPAALRSRGPDPARAHGPIGSAATARRSAPRRTRATIRRALISAPPLWREASGP